MSEKVIIEFQANTDGLDNANSSFQKLGATEKKVLMDMNAQIAKNNAELQDSNSLIGKNTKSVEDLAKAADKFEKAAIGKIGIQTFKQLQAELGKSSTAMQGLNILVTKGKELLANAADKGSDQYKKLEQEVAAAEIALESFGNNEQKITTKIRENTQAIITLQTAMEQMRQEGKQSSDVFNGMQQDEQRLIAETAELKDQLGDLKSKISALSQDNVGFQALTEGAATLSASMQVTEGIMNLLGDQNQEYQVALLKINSLMAITQGLQQVSNVVLDQSILKTYASVAAQKLYALVIGETTGALRIFRLVAAGAIAATGVGLLIAIAMNWDKIKEAIGGVNSELQKNVDISVKQVEASEEALRVFDLEEKRLRLIGKAEEDIIRLRQIKITQALDSVDAEKAALKNQLDAAAESNSKLEAIRNWNGVAGIVAGLFFSSDADIKKVVDQQKDLGDKETDLLSQFLDTQLQLKKISEEKLKAIDEQRARQLEKDNDEYKKSLMRRRQLIAEIEQQLKEDIKTRNEERIKLLKEQLQKEEDLYRQSLVNRRILEAEQEKARLDILAKQSEDRRQQRLIEIKAEISDRNNAEQTKQQAITATYQLIGSLESAISNFIVQQGQQQTDAKIAQLEKAKDRELANKNLTEAQKARIQDRYARQEAKLKNDQAKKQRDADLAQAGVALALAILNAAQTKPFIPLGLIAVASATLLGAVQLATIASTPLPQFAKGTKSSPAGFKWVGEEGPELMYDGGGKAIITHKESLMLAQMLDKYGIAHDVMNGHSLKSDLAAYPNAPAASHSTIEKGREMMSVNNYNQNIELDYDKFGEAVGNQISKHPTFNIQLDKNGFTYSLQQGGNRSEFLNTRNF
ncbi:MAG: hypothetical protein IT271_12495 [Chitinophagales bacterium]|nr:hypothetical protein [Chitinophagales bacterium]